MAYLASHFPNVRTVLEIELRIAIFEG